MRLPRSGSTSPRRNGARRLSLVVVAVILAVIAWAWIDGGHEPLHEIAEPVAVPGSAQ